MISIIGTVGVPACYGGFESLVEHLLPSEDIELIYCSSKAYEKKLKTYKEAKLYYVNINANGLQSVFYDIYCIFHSIFRTENKLLILGVSGAISLPIIRLFSSRRIVTNIDGLEWKRDKWGKLAKSFLKFSERLAVKYSDKIIADNQAIADYVKAEYNISPDVIAYGGDHAITETTSKQKSDYSLALCRIEPENNVEMILEAFSNSPDIQLKFIGNWQRSTFGQSMFLRFSGYKNIELIDPIYNLDQLFQYRNNCKYYIHGHSAGGTNPSLVEMMFFEIPIIAFDCSYNRASTEDCALFFKSADDLIEKISTTTSYEFTSVANNMLHIAQRRYTWSIIRKKYIALFK